MVMRSELCDARRFYTHIRSCDGDRRRNETDGLRLRHRRETDRWRLRTTVSRPSTEFYNPSCIVDLKMRHQKPHQQQQRQLVLGFRR